MKKKVRPMPLKGKPRHKAAPANAPASAAVGVQFVAVVNRGVSFVIDEAKAQHVKPPVPGMVANVELTVAYDISEWPPEQGRGAVVSLDITAIPDPNHQPYTARARVSGIFIAPPEITAEAFREFCTEAAPTILFPFVRNMIAQASTDGPFGLILINPVNLRGHFQMQREGAAAKTK